MPQRQALRVTIPISHAYLDEHPDALDQLADQARTVALKQADDPELQTAEILPQNYPMPGLDLPPERLAELRLCLYTYSATPRATAA